MGIAVVEPLAKHIGISFLSGVQSYLLDYIGQKMQFFIMTLDINDKVLFVTPEHKHKTSQAPTEQALSLLEPARAAVAEPRRTTPTPSLARDRF